MDELNEEFIKALQVATFVRIDDIMCRVDVFDDEDCILYCTNEDTGDEYLHTKEELIEDMSNIVVYTIKRNWENGKAV